ncbi:MAG TPA: hypothetical protein VKY74_18965 [Chloroflexia bacterium]|nr:hypothetical protein [Chloroflexia bacterium]
MHGQAYYRKGMIAHVNTALEEYLWLAAQVPEPLLDTVPPGAPGSVRTALLELALELDTVAYPALIALLEGAEPPATLPPALLQSRRHAWEAAELMVAMKQIRYRFQATEALLQDTPAATWGVPGGRPTPLAAAVLALWRQLLARLDTLAATVAGLGVL